MPAAQDYALRGQGAAWFLLWIGSQTRALGVTDFERSAWGLGCCVRSGRTSPESEPACDAGVERLRLQASVHKDLPFGAGERSFGEAVAFFHSE